MEALTVEAQLADRLVAAQRKLHARASPLSAVRELCMIDQRLCKEAARRVQAHQRFAAVALIVFRTRSWLRRVQPKSSATSQPLAPTKLGTQCVLLSSLRQIDAQRRPLAEEALSVLRSHASSLTTRVGVLRRRLAVHRTQAEDAEMLIAGRLAPKRAHEGLAQSFRKTQCEVLAVERQLRDLGRLDEVATFRKHTARALWQRGTAAERAKARAARLGCAAKEAPSRKGLPTNKNRFQAATAIPLRAR